MGFSVDTGINAGEHLRNACTEITSADNNDVCNLASLNLANIQNKEELASTIHIANVLLLCGTMYSALPLEELKKTREKNRRLGLGMMGIHEWLLVRGHKYQANDEFSSWLDIYKQSGASANQISDVLGISRPVKTRALAPTGTISIIGETTSSLEPLYCVAFKRRYLKGKDWHYQYVVDATAQRIIDKGVDPHSIQDAYKLAENVEDRIAFQAYVQKYVDHGISSTINMPAWGSEYNNENTIKPFGETLMKYLPQLRGITVYPDGARGGQPLSPVSYEEAMLYKDIEMQEYGNENACIGGVCGI